jgi:hypothetical protein
MRSIINKGRANIYKVVPKDVTPKISHELVKSHQRSGNYQ